MEFAHLHVHTDASKIDGLGPVDELVEAAKNKGFTKLAMTDHGTLANTVAFISSCRQRGIKPLIGLEGYVAIDGNVGHITLLADGERGFKSLVELNNAGHRSKHPRPAFSLDDLLKYHEGLICMTGCVASPLQSLEYPDARNIAVKLKGVYGSRLFSEAMFVSDTPHWERAAKLCKDVGLSPVITNDVHFALPEYADVHKTLVRLKAGFDYNSTNLYLASPEEIIERARKLGPTAVKLAEAGIRNASKLSDKLEAMKFSGVPTLPDISDAHEQIEKLANQGLVDRFSTRHDRMAAEERLKLELSVIKTMDYSTYFYVLHDVVSYARKNDVRVGPGRGSGAGSLVLYLLGITEVNPLDYDLSFERFLNPKRKGMPDVDMDFESEKRDIVIDYAMKRWKAHPVATYSTYSHKTLVHDLCSHFKLPRDIDEEAADQGPESEAFERLATLNPHFEKCYNVILGQIRHMGQHAGGVIVTDAVVPLERTSGKEGRLVAAWTEGNDKQLSAAGIVKYDFLGLAALSILARLEHTFGHRAPDPVDNDDVFTLFQKGETTGIFQFTGSAGIVEFTKKIRPTTFEDLVAINALYRPGALDAGTAEKYPDWKKSPRKLHPKLDPILAPTYGVIVYQEQVMAVYAAITGGDLADADLARRVIVKSKRGDPEWEAQVADLHAEFSSLGVKNGFETKLLDDVWSEIITHTRYSFNKSHAVAYARVAWDLAWWKYHHPHYYYTQTLNVDSGEAQRYIFDAARNGIKIVAPHVSFSGREYTTDGKVIYLPLTSVKFLGESGVDAIIQHRPFVDMKDFMRRVPKKEVKANARLGLYETGAFSGVPGDREDLDIKPSKVTGKKEAERTYLGFIIPEPKTISMIEALNASGRTAGIIVAVKQKSSKYGDYFVYVLQPNGSFWIRETKQSLSIGDVVSAKVTKNSGKATQVEVL